MFPWNRWRSEWKRTYPPRFFEGVLALWQLGFGFCLFLVVLSILFCFGFSVWVVVRDGPSDEDLFTLAGVGLVLLLFVWGSWRFLRTSWTHVRALRDARLAERAADDARP
jgi:hypothetical protein